MTSKQSTSSLKHKNKTKNERYPDILSRAKYRATKYSGQIIAGRSYRATNLSRIIYRDNKIIAVT